MVESAAAVENPGANFRNALRRYATGVTVITTVTEDMCPVGLTANSFNSVSLAPPLILWSLSKTSRSWPIFHSAKNYAVCVLGADQIDLASQFSSRSEDRFVGVSWGKGSSGVPILDNCAAWFECSNTFQHEAGDHTLFVGEVLGFGHSDQTPLLFASGAYGIPAPHPNLEPKG